MSTEYKLLLKEKDYQLSSFKHRVIFHHSVTDPLIHPPKISLKKNTEKNYANPLFGQLNPLNRVSRVPPKVSPTQQQATISIPTIQNAENQEEEIKKIDSTPWQNILQSFLKVYDVRRQTTDVQIANAFGSHGLKIEDQLRGNQSSVALSSISAKQGDKPKENRTTISMRTYLKILDTMKKDLKAKWEKNDKVGSLQISIQSCKLLHDTSNARFHALKFAYVLEIVERFGILVFQRIKSLSFPGLSAQRIKQLTIKDLQGSNIPESAQEICRNWLLKISSIRELIPRTIIETTLLRLHFFLDNGEKAKKVLNRLAKTNRCFGEQINCIFFCTFLIRMGKQVLPQDKDYILDILDDVFFYIKQGKTKFSRQDVSYDEFFNILEPFFMSSFQSLSESLQKDKFKRFCKILPQNPHPVILKNFIQSFSPSLLVYYSVDIAKMLQKIYKEHKFYIYKIMLERLRGMVFPQSGEFIVIAWTDFSELTDIQVMMDLLGPFSEIIFRNLPRYEKNRFYSLILDNFNNSFSNFRNIDKKTFSSFQKFLAEMLQKTEDLKDILTLEPFLQIVSYFPKHIKRQISTSITETFLMRDQSKINDPVIVHIMLTLMKNLQGMRIDNLAIKFLNKIDFQNDLQQSLNFFAEMRATFGYIQQVTTSLIYKAAALTVKARKLSKGRITTKLVSFLQAALAFCYITVPVLQSPELRLKIYLYLSEVALSNNLISQATSLIKTCITQLAQANLQSDIEVYQIFARIISFLIVVPDDPQNEYLFLFNGLFQGFSVARLKSNYQSILRYQFSTQCLVYLSCQAQERLPFHIEGVVSNDGLFKSKQFRKTLIQRIHQIFGKIEESMKGIEEVNDPQIDLYTLNTLIQCFMTILSTLQQTPRLLSFVNRTIKHIDELYLRVLSRDPNNKKRFNTALIGLNQILEANEFENLRVKIK